MSFSAAICPACNEYVLIKDGIPILRCPLCESRLLAREGEELLDKRILDPSRIHESLAMCIKLETEYGAELPLLMLSKMAEAFPTSEEIAFMLMRISNYTPYFVAHYLTQFHESTMQVPFAEEFLDSALIPGNLKHADLFRAYIDNKLSGHAHTRYLECLNELRATYKVTRTSKAVTTFLLVYFAIASVANILLAGFLAFDSFITVGKIGILIGAFFVEIVLLFIVCHKHGVRSAANEAERILLVIYMCTTIVAVGGMFLGLVL